MDGGWVKTCVSSVVGSSHTISTVAHGHFWKGHLHTFSCDLLICHCHSPLCLVWYLEPALFPDFHSWEQLAISNTVALRWLRCIVTSHSMWSPNFDPRPVLVGFVVDKVALGQVLPPSTSVFPSHSHTTGAEYSFIRLLPVLLILETDCIVKQHTNKKCHNQRQYFTLSLQGQSAGGFIYYFIGECSTDFYEVC